METYKSLEAELYHKGHGARMQERKVANNTWLVRRGDNVAIRLHHTDILTYTPDERVMLNHGGWDTVTTKERMNRYLGRNSISSSYGRWSITINVEIHDVRKWGTLSSRTIRASIPYENGMALDTLTGTVVEHPDLEPVNLTQDIDRARARTNILNPVMDMLEEKMADETLTKDDLKYATLIADTYQERHEHLRRMLDQVESSTNWQLERFHDVFQRAVTKHSEIYYPLHEKSWEVKGQQRAEDLITPVDRSNNP